MSATRCSAPALQVHKKTGHARVRINGREYWLGRAGTPECEVRYRALITRWARAQADAVPAVEPPVERFVTEPTTIAAALAGYLAEMEGGATGEALRKNARWWLARSLAATLSQHAAVRLDDFGPKTFSRWVESVASSPMPHKRGGEKVPRTTTHVRKIVAELLRLIEWCVAAEIIATDKLVTLRCVKRLPLAGARSPVVRRPVESRLYHVAILPRSATLKPVYAGARCYGLKGDGVGCPPVLYRDAQAFQYIKTQAGCRS